MNAALKFTPRTQAQNRQFWKYASQLAGLCNAYPEGLPKKVETLGKGDIKKGWLALICTEVTGQPSSSKLSRDEGFKVINALEKRVKSLGDEAKGDPLPKPQGAVGITPDQQKYLGKLVKAVAKLEGRWQGMAKDKGKMMKWATHYLKSPWPQNENDGHVAIEAFKSILKRSLPKKSKLQTARKELLKLREKDVLTPWETRFVTDGDEIGWEKWGPLQWDKLWEIAQARLPQD